MTTETNYWNYRGSLSYQYKGETFYTVTPIPFYYRRRALLLDLMKPLIANDDVKDVCDFGCGDGWYIRFWESLYPDKRYYGIDISSTMIGRARNAAPFANLRVSQTGIDFEDTFNLIYAIAVFQHIKDDVIHGLFSNIFTHLKPGSRFALFEATGFNRSEGEAWCRRTTLEYIELVAHAGFEIERRYLIAFPLHRFFEKRVAPLFIRLFAKGSSHHERWISANKQHLFKIMSTMFLNLTKQAVQPDEGCCDGNTLYVLKRPEG